ncbi:NADPH:quinone reductase [Pseudomonas aeruginosa]|uniref:NADPH:quinone reductase n=1 Tax=Pseudomonas aeruginosa TaxID=287 RepID=UPI000F76D261|nr:NADPH:quinone reductase [Pseudomonas aeruginosa]MBG4641243.1 NADPH:quinone reductase [Pseudomonas aeruginosa]RRW95622.1 NADPH:quinone reductase [Pseudomonas aeruginosa]
MAKRIQFAAYGGPEVLEYRDYQPAEPGPREVRVRNRAIGLNFIDTYYRSGLYPAPGFPSGLGSEGAGEVEAVGSEVTRFKVGDRVAYATGPLGAYSELHVLAEEKLVHLPDGIDFEQAAAVMLKGLTTQYLLRQTYELRGGETILFHAAAGGVGLFACQWAKALGVQLIGTVSSPEKARLARQHGAWETIDYSHETVARRVLELTDGKKCPVVYDSVGKDTWETSLDCVAPRGLLVSFGNASGPVTGVNLGILSQKGSLYVTRPTLGSYADTPEKLQAMADELFGLIERGDIRIEINQRFALAEAARAHTELAARRTTGSTVLLP